uniref:Uncharacterized protein n=1 Tax=Anopheles atroparvus TaxID=41427 RepID=A0A182IJ34_ANOAO
MLSAVDTLLEAAKFLEQQEQQHPTRQLQASRSYHRTPPPLHHQQHHATTNTSVSSNSGRPGAAAANSNGTVSYATTIVSNGNGGLFGGSSTSSASGIVSSTSTSTTTITGNGGNGFVSPPPAGNSIINGNHHGSPATGLPLKSKVLLNGLAHNHLQHQHPHQLPQQANGSGGRLLSPTLVSLPTGAALSSAAAAAGSYHQPTVTTIATSPAPRLQHLPIVATRKRTYSNASNGGGPTVSSTSSPPSTTTATVLVGSAASYVTKVGGLIRLEIGRVAPRSISHLKFRHSHTCVTEAARIEDDGGITMGDGTIGCSCMQQSMMAPHSVKQNISAATFAGVAKFSSKLYLVSDCVYSSGKSKEKYNNGMYNDGKRYHQHNHHELFGVSVSTGAGDQLPGMENRFPYSILSKNRGAIVTPQHPVPRPAPPTISLAASYLSALDPLPEGLPSVGGLADNTGSTDVKPPSNVSSTLYGNTVVTDVGICFSMSNVSLNGEFHAPLPTVPTAVPPVALPAHQRRRSHEDPGPDTVLINARRRAAALVTQYPHHVVDDILPPEQLHHHQHHIPEFGASKHHLPVQSHSFPGVHFVQQPLHHAVTKMSLQQQPQQACVAAHPVRHSSLPRQRSLVLPGKGAYGSSRSPSTDMAGLVRGVGSSSVGAGCTSFTLGKVGSGLSRSSPPYFKQPVGGIKTHMGQPSSTSALGSGSSGRRVPMQYLPSPDNVEHLAVVSPPTAVLEYYRIAIETAESVDKGAVRAPDHTSPTSVSKGSGSVAPVLAAGAPLVDYSGMDKLRTNCCYNGTKQIPVIAGTASPVSFSENSPSPTPHTPPSLAPPQAILSRSCPSLPHGLQYPLSPLNSIECQNSVTTKRADDAGHILGHTASLALLENEQVGNQQRHAVEIHPMDLCIDGEDNDDKPQDLSMQSTVSAGDDLELDDGLRPPVESLSKVANRRLHQGEDRGKRELKVAPKKKWIRHYMKARSLHTTEHVDLARGTGPNNFPANNFSGYEDQDDGSH